MDAASLGTTPALELEKNHEYPPDLLDLTEPDFCVRPTSSLTESQKIKEAAYMGYMRAHGIKLDKHEHDK